MDLVWFTMPEPFYFGLDMHMMAPKPHRGLERSP